MKLLPDPSPGISKRQALLQQASRDELSLYDADYARPVNEVLFYLGEHAAVVGATGSGKTYFTIKGLLPYMQAQYPNVPRYILDSTGDPKMDEFAPGALHVEGNEVPDLLHSAEKTLIWTPRNSKRPAEYNEWFNRLIDSRRPAIVVIDEIASITRQALEGLEALFKQFRKHGGTVIAETQRIAKVDTDIFSQISHFFLFQIGRVPYDLQQAYNYLGMPKEEFVMPSKYGFWHRKTREDFPASQYIDLHHFFKGAVTYG